MPETTPHEKATMTPKTTSQGGGVPVVAGVGVAVQTECAARVVQGAAVAEGQ